MRVVIAAAFCNRGNSHGVCLGLFLSFDISGRRKCTAAPESGADRPERCHGSVSWYSADLAFPFRQSTKDPHMPDKAKPKAYSSCCIGSAAVSGLQYFDICLSGNRFVDRAADFFHMCSRRDLFPGISVAILKTIRHYLRRYPQQHYFRTVSSEQQCCMGWCICFFTDPVRICGRNVLCRFPVSAGQHPARHSGAFSYQFHSSTHCHRSRGLDNMVYLHWSVPAFLYHFSAEMQGSLFM